MTDRLWMLLIVMVGAIGILTAVVFQERNKVQSLETERSACSDQREKLAFEASELNQQVTELKEKQRETERESRRSSGKLAVLEESLEKLEDERTVWEDEREKHKIREKHLKQQLDDFRSQLKASESATIEASAKLAALEESLYELEDERIVWEDEREKHKIHEKHLKQQLDDLRSLLKASELATNEGNANSRTHPMLIKEFKTRAALENNEANYGIAKLNEDIFVITSGSNAIERFDSASLSATHTLLLDGNLKDLQPCSRSQSLFVIERKSTGERFILNVDPYNKEIINFWEVDTCIGGLSVTEDCHVFATCYDKNTIIEYSSTGQLIQEIVLKPETGIVQPRLALKMTNGNFIVSFDRKNALRVGVVGIAIVNSNGDVLKSYSDPLKRPGFVMDMAIDRLGNVLVAELTSGRVMLLSPDLEYKRDIVTKEHGTGLILAMLLDEVNGRLFVADSRFNAEVNDFGDGRILVFDMK